MRPVQWRRSPGNGPGGPAGPNGPGGRRLAGAVIAAMLLVGGIPAMAHAGPDAGPGASGQDRVADSRNGNRNNSPDSDSAALAGASASATSLPDLAPGDGAYLEGIERLTATPTLAGDSVTEIAVDGKAVDAERTMGVSRLGFDVGSNSTEARYGNYLMVNGDFRAGIGDLVNERGTIDIPNQHLVKGENTVEIFAGKI